MTEKNAKILSEAEQLFLKYGIKSLTMNDIARSMHISKKTLYKYCKDKSDLVCQVMKNKCDRDKEIIDKIVSEHTNAIDELIAINQYFSKLLQSMHPSIHYDLEKYYKDAWEIFDKYRHIHLKEICLDNLRKGVDGGLYRKDLNKEIISRFYIARIDLMFDATIFSPDDYNFFDVKQEILSYHIHGIASEKGCKYFESLIKNHNEL